jgi:hypothetical protein
MGGDDGVKLKDSFMCFEVCDWGSSVLVMKNKQVITTGKQSFTGYSFYVA